VVLVVITDGRGNVPLQVSQGGELVFPVGRKGIEDALEVARQIALLNKVKAVVLNPQPKHCSDLPIILAQALGAKIASIDPLESWEVENWDIDDPFEISDINDLVFESYIKSLDIDDLLESLDIESWEVGK
jgi:hypothetical protein